MKTVRSLAVIVGAAAMALALAYEARAEGEPRTPVARRGAGPEMARFYTGSLETLGRFPGKLVCLRCDLKPGPKSEKLCAENGHRHALSMSEGSMIHPLLAGTKEILERINSAELHGKEVTVDGKYYPTTGAILVRQITVGGE